jgi:hypothetical protein
MDTDEFDARKSMFPFAFSIIIVPSSATATRAEEYRIHNGILRVFGMVS